MNVVVGGIHIYRPHIEGVIELLYEPYRAVVRLLRIAEYAGTPVKETGHGRPGSAVFGSGHRMGGNIA